jgi:hypothetical protein
VAPDHALGVLEADLAQQLLRLGLGLLLLRMLVASGILGLPRVRVRVRVRVGASWASRPTCGAATSHLQPAARAHPQCPPAVPTRSAHPAAQLSFARERFQRSPCAVLCILLQSLPLCSPLQSSVTRFDPPALRLRGSAAQPRRPVALM